jgi:hypothetical protein
VNSIQNIWQTQAATFNATTSIDNVNVVRYEWDFGDGTKSSEASVSHSYKDAGTYTAKLTVYDAAGNYDSLEFTVEVLSLIRILVLVVLVSIVCVGIVFISRMRKRKI